MRCRPRSILAQVSAGRDRYQPAVDVRFSHTPIPLPQVASPNGPWRVLILEDNASDALLLRRLFEALSEARIVATAASLAEGLSLLREQEVDVVLSDLTLEDSMGVDTVTALREVLGHRLLIAVSDADESPVTLMTLQSGANEFIPKADLTSELIKRAIRHGLQRAKMDLQLRQLAKTDALTRAANAVLLKERLAQTISRAERTSESFSLLFLDLDGFKAVNDKFGHAAGDEVIVEVACRLAQEIRAYDTVGRMGGDEFAIILDGSTESDAEKLADRLIDVLNVPIETMAGRAQIGASVGISQFPQSGSDVRSLLSAADAAMYVAKSRGTNQRCFHRKGPKPSGAGLSNAFARKVRRALEKRQFALFFQPQINLSDGSLWGFEALLRWIDDDGTIIPPAAFLPQLSRSDLIHEVGDWVCWQALHCLSAWDEISGDPSVCVAVNLSPRQLSAPDLGRRVQLALEASNLEPSRLELEITEDALLRNGAVAQQCFADLRRLGVQVALDDFGTGQSSLAHLRDFPADTIKIDRSFVSTMNDGDRTGRLASAICQLGLSLGVTVVAEGIETAQQSEILTQQGCHRGQGYFLGRPAPHMAFPKLAGTLAATG